MAKYALDLTQHAFSHKRGDLMIYGAWHGESLRPCLVVLPAFRVAKAVPLVIEVDDAWRWNPDDIEVDPRRNAQLVGRFLRDNGMDHLNTFTAMKVVSLVHDHLGDLLRIKPKVTEDTVVADAFHTDKETGKVLHREILERV